MCWTRIKRKAEYFTTGRWIDFIKKIPINKGKPCKVAILITINKIKVFYLDKDQKTPYFLNKLKVGDKILIKDIYNLLENIDNNLIEEEIIKL